MAYVAGLCLLLIVLFQRDCCALALEDLLDEYVKHVDSVNKPRNSDRYSSYSDITKYQRNKREDWDGLRRQRNKRDLYGFESNQWMHSEVLDKVGNVVLRWQPRHQEILFRVEARTRGYVGIGFSPNGGMEGADIAIGWVDDVTSVPYLLDCHGGTKSQGSAPIKDEIDNYKLMRGIQNDTHTIIEFRRVLDTCDPDDYVLTGDTVRVIWAMHDNDPHRGAEMVYHENKRGSQSLHLLGPPSPSGGDPTEQVRAWDVALKDFEVPDNMNTVYWCKIFKAPTLNKKHHIIGYEPLIGANHTNFVHHMLLRECDLSGVGDIKRWDTFAKEKGTACYDDFVPAGWERCLTTMLAYGVGAKGEFLPNHVGLPLSSNTYFMLEVHFDNPSMKRAVDTTGFRLRYTSRLRENEGGMFVAGVALSSLHFIPPMQNEYKSAGYCSMGCTKELFPKEGISVVSVVMHSHLAGRKMKLRHIRGGKELPPIVHDNRYDFDYQQSRTLSHEVNILPGDALVTECTYSTAKRDRPTLGGFSTSDEMCMAFITYYPRTDLAGCDSMPPVRYFFETLGVKEFYGKNMTEIEKMILRIDERSVSPTSTTTTPLFPYNPGDEMSPEANQRAIDALKNAKEYTIEGESPGEFGIMDQLIIKEPQEFQNKSFMSHLRDLPYNETLLTKKIEEYFYTGLHLTFCRKRDDTLAIREIVEKFPNFTAYVDESSAKLQCSYRLKNSLTSSAQMHVPAILVYTFLWIFYVIRH